MFSGKDNLLILDFWGIHFIEVYLAKKGGKKDIIWRSPFEIGVTLSMKLWKNIDDVIDVYRPKNVTVHIAVRRFSLRDLLKGKDIEDANFIFHKKRKSENTEKKEMLRKEIINESKEEKYKLGMFNVTYDGYEYVTSLIRDGYEELDEKGKNLVNKDGDKLPINKGAKNLFLLKKMGINKYIKEYLNEEYYGLK